MVAVSIIVGPADSGAPLRIAVIRAQICDHDNDAFACSSTCTATVAGWASSGRQVITLATSSTAPGSASGIIERL
jgi:hypothetical protein